MEGFPNGKGFIVTIQCFVSVFQGHVEIAQIFVYLSYAAIKLRCLLMFFSVFMMIYGVYKAQNWTEITPLPCLIVGSSIVATGLAEYELHRYMKEAD